MCKPVTPVIGQMLDVQAESHLSLLETSARATRTREIDGNAPLFSHPQYKSHVANFKQICCDLYSGKHGNLFQRRPYVHNVCTVHVRVCMCAVVRLRNTN